MGSKSPRNNLILFGLLIFVALSIFLYKSLANNLDTTVSTVAQRSPAQTPDQAVISEYKNGTYTSIGSYVSPGGPEEIELTLVITNDVVEDAVLVAKAELPASKFFQDKVAAAYKEFVVGKNINEVRLDAIAGSSLTPIGFNEAVENIKAQAKS